MIRRVLKYLKRQIYQFINCNNSTQFGEINLIVPRIGELTLRQVRSGDEEGLVNFRMGLSNASRNYFEGHSWDFRKLTNIIKKSQKGIDYRIVIIDKKGKIIGYGFLQDIYGSEPILGIGILDEYQNCGIGKILLSNLISVAKKLNKKHVLLTVIKENSRAIYLYKKLGFKIEGETFDEKKRSYYKMKFPLKGAKF